MRKIINGGTAAVLLAGILAFGAALVLQESRRAASRTAGERDAMHADTPLVTAYNRRLDELSRVDPSLILYRESAALIPPGLDRLTTIAVDADDWIYAAGGGKLVVFTQQGELIREITTDAPISCIAVDAQKRIYAGLGNAVHIYDETGSKTGFLRGIESNAVITSLAAMPDAVFAADAAGRKVLRFSPDGFLQQTNDGRQGDPDALGFLIPSPFFDITPGQGDTTLWIVNPGRHRLEEYTLDGERINVWQSRPGMAVEAFAGCCNPTHVARLSDGSIVTSEKGLSRIKVYTRRGILTGVVAVPAQFDRHDGSLVPAVDSKDRILVADSARTQIRVFIER